MIRREAYANAPAGVCHTGAVLLARPKTAKFGGYWAAALFVLVFPANIYAAVKPVPPFDNPWLGYGRLPLQVPLVLWALRHARR